MRVEMERLRRLALTQILSTKWRTPWLKWANGCGKSCWELQQNHANHWVFQEFAHTAEGGWRTKG